MRIHLLLASLFLLSCGSEPPPPPPDAGCTPNTPIYRDADGDGYGDSAWPRELACAGQVPAGYATNNLDCADGDARAHVGVTTFQTSPITGPTIDPWDFNCDGMVTLQYPSAPQPCNIISGSCYGTPGIKNTWLGTSATAPVCGDTRTWMISCQAVTGGCVPNGSSRTQGCL